MRIAMVAAKFTPAEAERIAPRHGDVQARRDDREFRRQVHRRHDARAATIRQFADALLQPDPGLRRIRLPRKPRGELRQSRLRLVLDEMPLPRCFAAALLNSQPMGFYAPAQIVRDAQEHGVEVRAGRCESVGLGLHAGGHVWPNGDRQRALLHSAPRHACKDDIRITHALRLGFRQISGFSEDAWPAASKACAARGFNSVRDLWLRTRLPPAALERLANADAFRSLGLVAARCALGRARAAARRRQGRPAAVRARRDAGAGARRAICRRCRPASRSSRTIATCICR